MFDIGPGEFLVLLVLAVVLFGPERLPELVRKAARTIRYVRTMADNAQRQLKDELGPDFSNLDVRDLNPKTFVRKHLLDEVEPVVTDVKNDVMEASAVNGAIAPSPPGSQKALSSGGPHDLRPPEASPAGAAAPFDSDAT
ncbi:MAG TPA: sec-independent translocase [Propionibacteriaceae bacterium]|nr:sec-independent translocase [Propionibacteriaceae bacterium]